MAGGTLGLPAAATLMEVSYRRAKRLYCRYRAEGAAGLQHRSAARASNRTTAAAVRERALALIREKYSGGVDERFGPFGVLEEMRGTGLGKVLLHLVLERMRARRAHSAWFLWTGAETAAGVLYLRTGFDVTRTFTVLRAPLA